MLKEKLIKKIGRRIECGVVVAGMLWLTRSYPLMWPVLFIYVLKEGVFAYFAHNARQKKQLNISTRWYDASCRGVTLLVLFVLFIKPDIGYFKANILMSVGMIFMGLSGIGRIWCEISLRRGYAVSRRKKWCMRMGGFLLLVIYYLTGILISGMPQPRISTAYEESLTTEQFYGEEVCGDRATIFEDNEEALFERVRFIHNAKERVILSTFDFRDDKAGRVMLAALLAAAERGVQVQVIADGVSGMLRMGANPYFMALSTHENAEIRIYNQINLLKPWALMGRLHDKYVIADDTAYFLGGRNTFSYFLGATDGHINYDRDVFVYNANGSKESSLYQVEAYFYEVWNKKETKRFHDWSAKAELTSVKNAKAELIELLAAYYAAYPEVLAEPDYTAMTVSTEKITLLANPTTIYAKEPTVFYALTKLMAQAKENVTIHTPYLICNEMMYDAFTEIAAQVPKVQLMTNSAANNGNPFGSGDYMAEFSNILKTGMEIYEYEGGVSYHAKSIAIDDDLSVVGSFNMDMRSVYLDTELMLVVDSTELNRQLRGIMEQYQAQSGVVAIDGTKTYPDGVKPQIMSQKKQMKVHFIYTLLGWARRLL